MAARFLLDANISPVVARGCRDRGLDVKALVEVMEVDSPDDAVFEFASKEGRILVTYNNRDFARLLGDTIREGLRVSGVVFVSGRTIPSSDFGGLAKALLRLAGLIDRGLADASGGLFLSR